MASIEEITLAIDRMLSELIHERPNGDVRIATALFVRVANPRSVANEIRNALVDAFILFIRTELSQLGLPEEKTPIAADTVPNHVDILEQRGRTYGPNPLNQETVAKIWEGLLMSAWQMQIPPIPPHVVALMMVGLKLNRAACPFEGNSDNYVDAHGYTEIARRCDTRESKTSNEA